MVWAALCVFSVCAFFRTEGQCVIKLLRVLSITSISANLQETELCMHGRWMKEFWMDEQGATAIEYALIAGIVSISIVGALYQISPLLAAKYQSVADGFNN